MKAITLPGEAWMPSGPRSGIVALGMFAQGVITQTRTVTSNDKVLWKVSGIVS